MINTRTNYDLSTHNTFAMQVKCGVFIEYTSAADIPSVLLSIGENMDYVHIGAGSNLLFTGDYPGAIIHSAIKGIDIISCNGSETIVRVGAGETMDDFIIWACDHDLWGIENLSGIPGEVGASAVQNVGAYGTEACDSIVAVHTYDTIKHEFTAFDVASCDYGYRSSAFKQPDNKGRFIIHAVDYRLHSDGKPKKNYPALINALNGIDTKRLTPHFVREVVINIRNAKLPDPAKIPSAGSFFKNPVVTSDVFDSICRSVPEIKVPHYPTENGVKIPAAWLIDQCGLKGESEGNASVWHLQPLVIVNPDRKATPDEVMRLEDKIINSVAKRFGIILTPEVEHIQTLAH